MRSIPIMPAWRRILPCIYLLVLAWVNVYICREMFFTEHTGYMNSMHGYWLGIANLASPAHWFEPSWWPYSEGGMPFEHAYSPLVPALTAAISRLAACSPARAYHALSGFFYCLGPLALFVMAWGITRAPGSSFIAAAAYSLLSPTELLIPDDRFSLIHVRGARRLYLAVVWDETPHLASLAFALLAILFLFFSLRRRQTVFYLPAGILIAAAVLANPFGGVLILIALFCLVFAGETRRASSLALGALIGATSYLVISPWYPPSLLATIRQNAARVENLWTASSWLAFLAVLLGWLLLWRALHRWLRDSTLRFYALLAYVVSVIPLLYAYAGLHFVTQPARLKIEMEMALPLLVVFAVRAAAEKLDRKVQAALALLILWSVAEQVISHRRFAKGVIRSIAIESTVEHQLARWVERHFPGQRVMMPGSIAQWLNAFSATPQLAGGSFPTAPNWIQQIAVNEIYRGSDGDASVAWLKAFGVQAVAVSGRGSREFWKPYTYPQKFDGLLPLAWRQNDLAVYQVPQRSSSLAHAIPSGDLVRRSPRDGLDLADVRRYVTALDNPALPPAVLRWSSSARGHIVATLEKDHVLSVQVNYHPGWRAAANGKPSPTFPDGLGLLALTPDCQGRCEIELHYDGGWQLRFCRWLSALTLLGVLAYAASPWRRLTAPDSSAGAIP